MAIDLAALLQAHRHEKFELFERHLNGQLVRVLRTIGFDRDYVRGEGAHLYDACGNRYLDLLSGFGVFALGRNHPGVAGAPRAGAEGAAGRPGPARHLPAGGAPGQAPARARAVAGQGVLLQFGRGSRGSGDQVQPCGHAPLARPVLRACLPRPHLRRALPVRRPPVPGRLRAAAPRLRSDPLRRPRRPGAGADPGRRRGLRGRADPGQGREPALARVSARGGAALPPAPDAPGRRRDPDRHGPHRPLPRVRARGRGAGHGAARQGALGRLRPGRRGAAAARHLRDGDEAGVAWIVRAFDAVIQSSQSMGGVWDLGRTLAGHAMRARAGAA